MSEMRIVKTIKIGGDYGKWTEDAPVGGDIDIDNDGIIDSPHQFEVDLSKIASKVLGKQSSMMSSCRLNHIEVVIVPTDGVVDNDESSQFMGRIWWTPPTDHCINALKLARKAEKANESSEVDADSLFLTTDNDYVGFRYGYNASSGVVDHQTASAIAGMPAWTLSALRTVYNAANPATKTNALWTGRFPEECNLLWETMRASGVGDGDSPPANGHGKYDLGHLSLPVIRGAVEWSSCDETGAVDDDYDLWLTIDFTPEIRSW